LVLFANMRDTVLSNASIKLQQYVASCSLGGLPCNITRDFSLMFHPYYYNCYTYHKPRSPSASAAPESPNDADEEGEEKDLPWLMPGLDNGLSVVVLTGSGMLDKNKGKVSNHHHYHHYHFKRDSRMLRAS